MFLITYLRINITHLNYFGMGVSEVKSQYRNIPQESYLIKRILLGSNVMTNVRYSQKRSAKLLEIVIFSRN